MSTFTTVTPGLSEPDASFADQRGVWRLSLFAFLVFFFASAIRHWTWSSTAHDLGIFDQVLFLISTSQHPYSTIVGRHILADHASMVLYPLSLFYLLSPSPFWLFGIQAAALSSAVFPIYDIARRRALPHRSALALCVIFVCHPTVINSALFDFHPETIAVPALLWVCAAVERRAVTTCVVALIIALASKEIVSVAAVALGISVLLSGGRRTWGLAIVTTGLIWLAFTTSVLIPSLSHGDFSSGFSRYAGLGPTPMAAARTLLHHPQILLNSVINPANLKYLFLLTLPFAIALRLRSTPWLLGAALVLMVNFLSPFAPQRSIDFHYSLLALPLLSLASIFGTTHARRTKLLLAWGLMFAAVYHLRGVYERGRLYPHYWQSRSAVGDLIPLLSLIPVDASVITNAYVAPHLSHRKVIEVFKPENLKQVESFEYVLLPLRMRDVFCDVTCQTELKFALKASSRCRSIGGSNEGSLLFHCPAKSSPAPL